VRVAVRLFAGAADALGARQLAVELPDGATAGDLREVLARHGGPLLQRCAVAVDRRTVTPGTVLPPGAEVAVLPPVSGGEEPALLRLGPEAIDAQALLRAVGGADQGGQVLFLGTVRGHTDGAETLRLEYEAYTEMAEAVLQRVAAEAGRLWPGLRLAVWHRTGSLVPGEAAVGVAAAAAHRGDAFAAARFAIERVKAELPVWKREHAPSGAARWVEHA
jgi:molybdopterin synthase catalytic subunit